MNKITALLETSRAIIALLETSRAIIAKPEHWTKGALARDAQNKPVRLRDPEAFSFCASGAIRRARDLHQHSGLQASNLLFDALNLLFDALPEGARESGILAYNDRPGTTHADVLAVFDRAIAVSRKMDEDATAQPV